MLLTIAQPDDHNGRRWRQWGLFGLKKVITEQPTECKICGESKKTITCTVQGYRESGQRTPVLKIEVCEECLG